MKWVLAVCLIVGISNLSSAQKKMASHKLTKEEMTRMTPEQRLIHETQRKSNKKNHISNKKKVRIQKKQSRKSERIRQPKKKL
jgi:2-methylcitrate dehydratase PrpD